MEWAYGITTTPERQYSYLPHTVESLSLAGFDSPTLFVDGSSGNYSDYNFPVVYRSSRVQAFGNWWLALQELWVRNPRATRFAIFQDDFVCYRNLRQYLEKFKTNDKIYLNLYTFPENERIRPEGKEGWYPSNQRGRGAVALVFPAVVVFRILSGSRMINKPREVRNPHRSIDGVLVTHLSEVGIKEYVHYPTLTMHVGDCSSIGNRQHDKPQSWRGEDYDALSLLTPKVQPILQTA